MSEHPYYPQTKAQRTVGLLAPSLWSIAIAATLGVTVGATALPKVTLAAPRLSTTIAIGAGAAQVRVTINVN